MEAMDPANHSLQYIGPSLVVIESHHQRRSSSSSTSETDGAQMSSPSLFCVAVNGQSSSARAPSVLDMDTIEIDPSQQQSPPLRIDDSGHQVTNVELLKSPNTNSNK